MSGFACNFYKRCVSGKEHSIRLWGWSGLRSGSRIRSFISAEVRNFCQTHCLVASIFYIIMIVVYLYSLSWFPDRDKYVIFCDQNNLKTEYSLDKPYSVHTIHRPNVGSLLGQRRRRWSNIEPILGRWIVLIWSWDITYLCCIPPIKKVKESF